MREHDYGHVLPVLGTLEWYYTVRGQVRVEGAVEVGSEVSGRILEVFVEEGDFVEPGEILARLDQQTFQTRLRQAQAQLDGALAGSQVAATQFSLIEDRYQRQSQLSHGVVPAAHLRELEFELEAARARLQAARSEVTISEAIVDAAQLDLDRTEIFAPIAGQVTRRNISSGETVNASQVSPVLFEITEQEGEISIYAEVPERFVQSVVVGKPVDVRSAQLRDSPSSCLIDQKYRRPVQRASFVFYGILITCTDAPEDLWAGMTVEADLELRGHESVLHIPRGALLSLPGGLTSTRSHAPGFQPLFVLDEHGDLVERSVRVGYEANGVVEITDGDLEVHDRILVTSLE